MIQTKQISLIYRTVFLFAFALYSLSINAQNNLKRSEVKTSIAEYDFLTKTYPANNLKTLNGYKLTPFYIDTVEQFYFVYELFIENNTNNVKAVLIKITKEKKGNNKVRYLCMPINNSELFDKFNQDVNKLGISMLSFFECLNRVLLSKFIDNKYNTDN